MGIDIIEKRISINFVLLIHVTLQFWYFDVNVWKKYMLRYIKLIKLINKKDFFIILN